MSVKSREVTNSTNKAATVPHTEPYKPLLVAAAIAEIKKMPSERREFVFSLFYDLPGHWNSSSCDHAAPNTYLYRANREKSDLENYWKYTDSAPLFDEALQRLIDLGLAEKAKVQSKDCIRVTDLGLDVWIEAYRPGERDGVAKDNSYHFDIASLRR